MQQIAADIERSQWRQERKEYCCDRNSNHVAPAAPECSAPSQPDGGDVTDSPGPSGSASQPAGTSQRSGVRSATIRRQDLTEAPCAPSESDAPAKGTVTMPIKTPMTSLLPDRRSPSHCRGIGLAEKSCRPRTSSGLPNSRNTSPGALWNPAIA